MPDQSSNRSRRVPVRLLAAGAGTAILVGYLVATTDPEEVWRTVQRADLHLFLVVALFFQVLTLLLDSWSMGYVLKKFDIRLGFLEVLRIRGASFLLDIVNYNLSLVLMTTLVAERSDRRWLSKGSVFLFLTVLDVGILSFLVLAALVLGTEPFDAPANVLLGLIAAGGALTLPVLVAFAGRTARSGIRSRWSRLDIFEAFRSVPASGLHGMALVRMIFYAMNVVETYLYLMAFGFAVPFLAVLVFDPIASVVATLPVTIGEIGSTQVVMRGFYSSYAPAGLEPLPAVDAFSTAVVISSIVGRLVIGIACLPGALRAHPRLRKD